MLLYNRIIQVRSVNTPYYYIPNEQTPFTNIFTRFNNIFRTFCLQRNNEREWFVEINEASLQYVAIDCYQDATVVHPWPPIR